MNIPPAEELSEKFQRVVHRLMGVRKRPDPRTSDTPIFASFQDRVFASMIDACLFFLAFHELFQWLSALFYAQSSPVQVLTLPESLANAPLKVQMAHVAHQAVQTGFVWMWLANSLVQSLMIGLVLIAMWSRFHTTPGKFLLGMKITQDDGETPPMLHHYLRRFAGFYVSMPPFMIGYAALALNNKKQAWHDRIGHTTVVYTREGHIFRRGWDILKQMLFSSRA